MAKERLDIFDCNYNHLGTEEKDEVHRKGLWHHTFHCWIVRPNGKVVLQLRSMRKDAYPGKLDISAAGHVSAGETVEEGGKRELKEELGIQISPDKFKYLGYFKQVIDINSKKIVPYLNTEFCHTYLVLDETPLNQYTMQPEEVDAVFEIDIKDGMKLFSDEVEKIKITGLYRGEAQEKEIEVTFDDFNPDHEKFKWLKIFIMAERLLEGKEYLAI